MRGVDHQQSGMFSYVSAERRVPRDHPLRALRVMVAAALKESSWRFDAVYASSGRPSIPPAKLLRAPLLQMLYTVRSERLLPAYAPELNPVEYLWSHWKQHELPNFCPSTFAQLSVHARRALKRMRRRPTLVMAFWQQAQLFPL